MDLNRKFAANGEESSNSIETVDNGADDRNDSSPATRPDFTVALEESWRTHAKHLLRVTHSITKNREDAEDALQDSFLRAWVHQHSFDGRSTIVTWLTRIAINSSLKILSKRSSAPQLSITDSANFGSELSFMNPVDSSPSPEERCAQLECQTIVRSAIGALNLCNRRALELQTLEERSTREIADRMGLSISAAKSRIFHAKAALRKSLGTKANRSARSKQMQLSAA